VGKGRNVSALDLQTEHWPFKEPFHITDYVFTNADVLVATVRDGAFTGRGEACGVYYRDETLESMERQVAEVAPAVRDGIDREALRSLAPPGGARNALDCALWDLDAKRAGKPAWVLAGLPQPKPLRTTFTVGAAAPDEMAKVAKSYKGARAIKLKLTRDDPGRCLRAVRAARPDVWIGVDANQGLSRAMLEKLIPVFRETDVGLIEQPFPVGQDAELDGLNCPIPIAADESVQKLSDLKSLSGRYDVINIKLDKCGGLTEGLAMAREARRLGMKVMVGCMSGTSLAMAPAFLLGQLCDFVDLDSPIFLARDRDRPALYENGEVFCPEELWGGAS
jgi:L-alanine-DL-glutamate epimerase-like enolase superfamily enzyme